MPGVLAALTVLLLALAPITADAKPRAATRAACRTACEPTAAACVAAAARPAAKHTARRCRRSAIRRCVRLGLGACPPSSEGPPCPDGVPSVLGTWEGAVTSCTQECRELGSGGGAFVERPCDPPAVAATSFRITGQACERIGTADQWVGSLDLSARPIRFGLAWFDPTVPAAARAGSSIDGVVDGEALVDVAFRSGNVGVPPFCRRTTIVERMTRVAD